MVFSLILYRLKRHFFSVQRWAVRRFTPAGLMVIAGLVVAGMFGLDPDNNVAYQGISLLMALLLLAFAFSWSFRPRFAATRVLPQFGTAGAALHYTILLKSLEGRAQKSLMVLEDLGEARPSFKEWAALRRVEARHLRPFRLGQRLGHDSWEPALSKPATVPLIPPGQETSVECQLTPLRRGVLRLQGIILARLDPFGLFRAFGKVPLAQTVLILPKRYPVPPIPLPGRMKYQQGGVALASSVGQSDEFVALRDYRHGDPVRHIHWRSWAKTGKPMVKEFEDEFFVRHALVLDTFTDNPRSELFEEAVSVAASFACTIQTQESLLDLLFVGPHSYCLTAGRGLAHMEQLLEVLASVRPCLDQPFKILEHLVLNHTTSVSGCICVLLAWDAARQDFVAKLRELEIPVMVLVLANHDDVKSIKPGPVCEEQGRFRVLEVGNVEAGLAELK
jgi:uncharacterized protein (DUF58 family)